MYGRADRDNTPRTHAAKGTSEAVNSASAIAVARSIVSHFSLSLSPSLTLAGFAQKAAARGRVPGFGKKKKSPHRDVRLCATHRHPGYHINNGDASSTDVCCASALLRIRPLVRPALTVHNLPAPISQASRHPFSPRQARVTTRSFDLSCAGGAWPHLSPHR